MVAVRFSLLNKRDHIIRIYRTDNFIWRKFLKTFPLLPRAADKSINNNLHFGAIETVQGD